MSHVPEAIQWGSIGVAGVGALLYVWAMHGDRLRGKGGRRCRGCGYDMSATAGLRCPECGHESWSEAAMLRPRRRWKWVVVGLVLCAAPAVVFGLGDWIVRGYWSLLPEWRVARVVDVGGTKLLMLAKTNPEEFGEAVDVVRDGRRVRLAEGGFVLEPGDFNGWNPTSRAVDLTGDGVPDVVLLVVNGDALQSLVIYDPTSVRMPLATFAPLHKGHYAVRDRNDDGRYEVDVGDYTFWNWREGYLGPVPAVVLTWQNGRFAPDAEFMTASGGLTKTELDEQAAAVSSFGARAPGGWAAPSLLWSIMLQLMYTGHARQAWELVDLSWPAEAKETKEEFRKALLEQLAKSPYWADIEKFADEGKPMVRE